MGKTIKGKDKLREKLKAMKRKIARKTKGGKLPAVMIALWALVGCATSEPASRATTARYGDISITVDGGSKAEVHLTIGDGALASADSAGSTETLTASPTNDVKPDIDVSVPVNKAGAAQSVGSVIGDAVAGLISGATGKTSSDEKSDCKDGNCSP